jgi:hypothetical protein
MITHVLEEYSATIFRVEKKAEYGKICYSLSLYHTFSPTPMTSILCCSVGGGSTLLQIAGKHLPDYMASHPERQYLHSHCCENLKFISFAMLT